MNDLACSPLELVTQALHFAAERHSGQTRKGEAGEPYVNHLSEVAALLAQATGGEDPNLVAAGLLHDVVEDTPTPRAEVARLFGEDIATLVSEVTDDKSLPKAERKRLQVEHAPKKTQRAKMIKLADKTSNLRAIAASPPADWSVERCSEYIAWAEEVVKGLRGANGFLETMFDQAAQAARVAVAAR